MLLLLHLEAKSKESSSVCDVQCVSLDLNTSPFLSTIEQGDSVAQYKGENWTPYELLLHKITFCPKLLLFQ